MENKQIYLKRNHPFDGFLGITVLILSGLILPLILVLIVKLTGFSEIFEEICKAVIVLFLILRFNNFWQKIIAGVLFGFLFSLSESLLYLNNIFQVGDFYIFWQRFFLATPMHIVTVLVILFFGMKSKKYIIPGTLVAIIIHLVFNYFVTSWSPLY